MTAFFKSRPLKMEALHSFETSGTTDAMTSLHISPVLTSQQLFSISFPVIILLTIPMFSFLYFFFSFTTSGTV